jgi:thiol-disulfide isomerase/thioredoxin
MSAKSRRCRISGMSAAKRLSRNPTLLTAVLSAAAVAGYLAYRLTAGGADDPAATMAGSDGTQVRDTAASMFPDALPDIVFDDLAGQQVSLASFTGKPLLINFWATWCGPCLQEIPLLKSFHADNDAIDVIGIAVDGLDEVLGFADDMQFNYPSLVGQAGAFDAMTLYRNDAQVMPFSVYTTADGAVLATHAGALHPEQLAHFAETIELLTAGNIDFSEARERMAAAN